MNEGIKSGYDWDKKLALKCEGTSRILHFFISDILPYYTLDSYYLTYNKLNYYYEFGKLKNKTKNEMFVIRKIRNLLNS